MQESAERRRSAIGAEKNGRSRLYSLLRPGSIKQTVNQLATVRQSRIVPRITVHASAYGLLHFPLFLQSPEQQSPFWVQGALWPPHDTQSSSFAVVQPSGQQPSPF